MAVDTHEADARREKAAALKLAREGRKAFAVSLGPIATQLTEAMNEYVRMRSEGVSREDACRGLEHVLLDVFPRTKFGPACSTCDDIGWRETTCTHRMRCGRQWCSLTEPAWEHLYVVPCDCPRGERRREQPKVAEDEIAAVGRTQRRQRKGWRGMGE